MEDSSKLYDQQLQAVGIDSRVEGLYSTIYAVGKPSHLFDIKPCTCTQCSIRHSPQAVDYFAVWINNSNNSKTYNNGNNSKIGLLH